VVPYLKQTDNTGHDSDLSLPGFLVGDLKMRFYGGVTAKSSLDY